MDFPNINPVLISLGPLAIRWYALAYIAGIITGWWYLSKLIGPPQILAVPLHNKEELKN